MKPWIWLVLFLLTVAGGVYLAKKQTPPALPSSEEVSPPPVASPFPGPGGPKPPQMLPAPRSGDPSPSVPTPAPSFDSGNSFSPPPVPEPLPESEFGQGTESYPGAIPPPPPPPMYPSPEMEAPPEYFDGEIPQPFEPPPPLDENEAPVPPSYDPGAEL